MTIPRLQGMNRYWRRNPPTHIAVKLGLGLKLKEEPEKKPGDLKDLIEMFQSCGGTVKYER